MLDSFWRHLVRGAVAPCLNLLWTTVHLSGFGRRADLTACTGCQLERTRREVGFLLVPGTADMASPAPGVLSSAYAARKAGRGDEVGGIVLCGGRPARCGPSPVGRCLSVRDNNHHRNSDDRRCFLRKDVFPSTKGSHDASVSIATNDFNRPASGQAQQFFAGRSSDLPNTATFSLAAPCC